MPNTHIALLLSLLAGFASCSILSPADKHDSGATTARVETDSSVIFVDTIDNIIRNADKILWYEMTGMTESADSANQDSILGHPVKRVHKEGKDRVLSFILSDKDWYISDYPPVKQQFHANIVFVFQKKHSGSVGMLVSFGSGEIAVTKVIPDTREPLLATEAELSTYMMRYPRILARWVAEKLPEDTYYKEYIKL